MKFNFRKIFPWSGKSNSWIPNLVFAKTTAAKGAQQDPNPNDSQLSLPASDSNPVALDRGRRKLIGSLVAGTGLVALSSNSNAATSGNEESLRFPGDPAENKVVYQFNKGDEKYHKAVLFSVGAMLRKYGDNIDIVVVGIGPGIHILAKKPERPVSDTIKQRVSSLLQYGVKFHACGNTMKALGWKKDNIIDGVPIVEVGAADLMELQAQGYSYISW